MEYAVIDYKTEKCNSLPENEKFHEYFRKAGFSYEPAFPSRKDQDFSNYSISSWMFFNERIFGTLNLVPMLNEGIGLSVRVISLHGLIAITQDSSLLKLFLALPFEFKETGRK